MKRKKHLNFYITNVGENIILLFTGKWMELENIMLSEVN
jgi:hypothetical protein